MNVNYEIKEEFGTISSEKGYETKVVSASWNGGPVRYEIRKFSQEGDPFKGIRLKEQEMREIKEILNKMFK